MTPTDILTAARANPLSPIVPAREEWLRGWQGPARDGEWNVPVVVLESFGPTCLVYGNDPTGEKTEWELRVVRIRLDLRRPEVRDRLVRCGVLPAPLRDHVVSAVGACHGVSVVDVMPRWRRNSTARDFERVGRRTAILNASGWRLICSRPHDLRVIASGPETGAAGRAACDLDALTRGCVLEEADGWYIPLPNGAVGWLPREAA